jgi:hypothetical protein
MNGDDVNLKKWKYIKLGILIKRKQDQRERNTPRAISV